MFQRTAMFVFSHLHLLPPLIGGQEHVLIYSFIRGMTKAARQRLTNSILGFAYLKLSLVIFPKLFFSITWEKMRVGSSCGPEKKVRVLKDTLQDKSHKWFKGEPTRKHYSKGSKAGKGTVKELQHLYAHLRTLVTSLGYLLRRRAASLTTRHPAGKFSSHCHWERMSHYRRMR